MQLCQRGSCCVLYEGLSSRMWVLLATLLLLHIAQLCSAKCNVPDPKNGILELGTLNSSCVNASRKNITKIQGKLPHVITTLDLSYNKLKELPQDFLDNIPNLTVLYLNDNELKQFPSKFSSQRLEQLRLEGNELTSLPTNFLKSLKTLSVDCNCGLVIPIFSYCNNSAECLLSIKCRKFSDTRLSDAREYYAQECAVHGINGLNPSVIIIAIVVPILILLLVAGVAYVLIQRKKGVTFGQDKRASNTSDVIQPRYLTHSGPQDPGTEHHANYENVFIDKPQEARSGSNDHRGQRQSKSRLSSSIQKAPAEQPIYANTQDVYYNYQGQTKSDAPDEEVYIMPDQ